jgi:hypothetical protein
MSDIVGTVIGLAFKLFLMWPLEIVVGYKIAAWYGWLP